ncbi:MAG: toprim domain-containing protein [Alphaproteobacteria bacterium]|nr:toprim domain-containing protein [Alphaproteobacteria bacterium]
MSTFKRLLDFFIKLPGVGPRQAERFVRYIEKAPPQYTHELSLALAEFKRDSKQCDGCYMYFTGKEDQCAICLDQSRNRKHIIIVEKDVDILALESTGIIDGIYFVLGGLIPIAKDIPTHVRYDALLARIKKEKPFDVTIAFSVHPDADHTIGYLNNTIQNIHQEGSIHILGRGMSIGMELEYADPETLIHAYRRRTTHQSENSPLSVHTVKKQVRQK